MTIEVPEQLARRLDTVARLDRKPAAQIIREALDQHLRGRFDDPDFQVRLRAEADQLLAELGKEKS